MSTNPELVNHIIQSMKKQQKQKKQTNLAYIPGVQTPEVKKSDDFNKQAKKQNDLAYIPGVQIPEEMESNYSNIPDQKLNQFLKQYSEDKLIKMLKYIYPEYKSLKEKEISLERKQNKTLKEQQELHGIKKLIRNWETGKYFKKS